jgi:CHAT domain-containing protein
MLFGLSDELAGLLLPAAVADDVGPLVVVPTAVLHDVPWSLLPPLAGRAVSVSASFTGWASAVRRREERMSDPPGPVGFIAGPGLDYAELEVETLAAFYSAPAVLVGADATVERGLDLFARADVAHVACHGHFRSDNPLFSAIHLADGPLSVYDFERLDRLPTTVILSACSVAGAKVLQGGSVLGLAAALTTLGAASVIAPLTPISDASSVEVMQRLHHELVAGAAPAAALAAAVLAHDMADPTAGAFIALGA